MTCRLVPSLAIAVALAMGLLAGPPLRAEEPARVTVFKSPTCGCCVKWVRHLESAGFRVTTRDVPDVRPIKRAQGVPSDLASCHTAVVDGYVIEGHVPAADVARLLEERPPVLGLAVPGMPEGSPGMEGPDPEPYRVIAFDAKGHRETFAEHAPGSP
jgi:hypothetical protein